MLSILSARYRHLKKQAYPVFSLKTRSFRPTVHSLNKPKLSDVRQDSRGRGARQDPKFVIVAHMDAPFEEALGRVQAYIEAGADMIKILPKTRRELELIPQR